MLGNVWWLIPAAVRWGCRKTKVVVWRSWALPLQSKSDSHLTDNTRDNPDNPLGNIPISSVTLARLDGIYGTHWENENEVEKLPSFVEGRLKWLKY